MSEVVRKFQFSLKVLLLSIALTSCGACLIMFGAGWFTGLGGLIVGWPIGGALIGAGLTRPFRWTFIGAVVGAVIGFLAMNGALDALRH